MLGEYFEDDWSKIEPVSVEPGHQAEWVWLLKGFERITGCPTGRPRAELLETALRYSDEATGCLFDEGDPEGRIRRNTRRLWPQTELAKAWIAQAEAGEAGAADQARAALTRLDRHYLSHPVAGGWYDRVMCPPPMTADFCCDGASAARFGEGEYGLFTLTQVGDTLHTPRPDCEHVIAAEELVRGLSGISRSDDNIALIFLG